MVEQKKEPVKDCCPYCYKPMGWQSWKECWLCPEHGRFDVEEAVEASPTNSTPVPEDRGELEYGTVLPDGTDWRLRRFDAGIGVSEYRIFRNEKFFAMFDNREDADTVMVAMTCDIPSVGEMWRTIKRCRR